jgi:hypothetical protein
MENTTKQQIWHIRRMASPASLKAFFRLVPLKTAKKQAKKWEEDQPPLFFISSFLLFPLKNGLPPLPLPSGLKSFNNLQNIEKK